jgi:hypothetical protein
MGTVVYRQLDEIETVSTLRRGDGGDRPRMTRLTRRCHLSAPGWVLPLATSLALAAPIRSVAAQVAPARDTALSARDGRHDFDFEIGTWVMHRRRLLHPLTGSTTWVDPGPATHLVRPIWGGLATLAELRIDTPTPHFVGSLLHLYNPQAHQWSVSWVSLDDATVAPPMIGSFQNGPGVFIDQEVVDGRALLVRVVYSDITTTSFRTERAFSVDGGTTWEVNAIDTYTRQ